MALEPSILLSTKKNLGVAPDYTPFDQDILTHINGTFAIVNQIGVGPPGYLIEDENDAWADLTLPDDQLGLLKTLIYLSVRLLFDPPSTSFHLDALKEQRDEFLTRLSYLREAALDPDDAETPSVPSGDDIDYASGVQSTPSLVWIMDHNLGYNPAAFRFFDEDGNELEPESVTYATVNRALATWPELIAGSWMAS